jgi:hypothetical protein
MDYTSLVASKTTPGSIASWANYGLAPASDVLGDAQTLLYTLLRTREMMSDPTVLTIAQDGSSALLPAGFLDPIDLRDAFGVELKNRDWSTLAKRRIIQPDGTLAYGTPRSFAILNKTLHIDCRVQAATNLQFVFYQQPALLSNANPTNFLTDRYPFLLRAACLAAAADFRKHTEDYQRQVQKLGTLIDPINKENDLYLRSVQMDPDWEER